MTAKPTHSSRATMRRLAMGSAIAAALLAGTAVGTAQARPSTGKSAHAAGSAVSRLLASGQPESAVTLGEKALAARPQDAGLRAALGQAYLHSGRFASAVAALSDAVSLGDQSGRTALGLALAQVANGQGRDAVATLDHAVTAIPAGDLGLAYALAGESARGVSILSDAVRAGPATPKLRQNLAYAYALDGRWTEARVTATVDVPADQIDSRLEQWAMSMRTGAERERIATLLGVPVRDDAGMPAALALNAPAPNMPEAATAQAAVAPAAELPPVAPAAQELAAAPAPEPTAAQAPADLAAAAVPAPTPVEVAAATPAQPFTTISQPVVQPLPAPASAKAPVRVRLARRAPAEAKTPAPAAEATSADSHVVQLGAFSSAKNAERAVTWFTRNNPQIAGHKLVITQATVHGRQFWRVAAAGFDAGSARGTCSALRQSGGTCFAHAAEKPAQSLAVGVGRSTEKLARR